MINKKKNSVIIGYELEDELARGQEGASRLYIARDVRNNRPVFVEMLQTAVNITPKPTVKFENRARILQSLSHPNIANVISFGIGLTNQAYAIIEYAPTVSLATNLARRSSKWSVAEALNFVSQIAHAMTTANAAGLAHHHLNPTNIRVKEDGTPFLIDLIVPIKSNSSVKTPVLKANGKRLTQLKITTRNNISSLGAILYELLTGISPLTSQEGGLDVKNVKPFAPLEEVRLGLKAQTYLIVKRCLQPSGSTHSSWEQLQQFESMEQLLVAIQEALNAERAIFQVSIGSSKNRSRATQRFMILIGGILSAIVLGYFVLRQPVAAMVRESQPDAVSQISATSQVDLPPTATPIPAFATEPGTVSQDEAASQGEATPQNLDCPAGMNWVNGRFCLDQHEITNAAYQACVTADICTEPSIVRSITRESYYADPSFANHPVIQINWLQASQYCQFIEGRLPTAEEWETAVQNLPAPLPDDAITRSDDTQAVQTNTVDTTTDDIFDMVGNVREWVADEDGISKVIKGKSFASTPGESNTHLETITDWAIGFRCAAQ